MYSEVGEPRLGGLPSGCHAPMPSVGMRRTTRVFGARVLRSGRRLWSAPVEGKQIRATAIAGGGAANGEEWIELFENSGDHGGGGSENNIQQKENGWQRDVGLKQDAMVMEVDEKVVEPEWVRNVHRDHKRMWGSVYKRKRKGADFEGSCKKKRMLEDKKYGKQFVRKQWGRFPCPWNENCRWKSSARRGVLFAVVESSSCRSTCWFACFLGLVLRYLRRAKLRLVQLSAFVLSEPFAHVFSSHGIHFLRDSPPSRSSGIFKISGSSCFIPLFTVDFSAVPFCFMYMHSTLLLRSACFSCVLEMHSNLTDDIIIEVEEQLPLCSSYERDSPVIDTLTIGDDNSGKRNILHSSVGAPRSTGRVVQTRSVVRSRRIQKRRSSLRSRRNKIPSAFRSRKANGALVSNLFSSRRDGSLLPPLRTDRQLRSSVQRISTPNIRELKSSLVGLTQDIGSTCCSANILVIESDKCFRIEGAIVKLEKNTASKQWCLAVKKDGMTRYTLSAEKVMRPCSSNRITHDIIWTEDIYNWKLEFPDRRDWMIFKELYKECSHRNVQAPSANTIPVPGVYEVSGYADSNDIPFKRPNSYISVKDDELSRALEKRTANYDLDSEDEEWLSKFNNESYDGKEQWEHVSEDSFELIIDAFEKAFYCSSDDYPDEKAAVNLCLDMERKEVVEAVYSYWMKKRHHKGSALVRIFQCYQQRRAQLLPKNILRKKRSFKRQPSHSSRGKQRTFLQVVPEQQDALEEKNALLRAQEAKAAASRSEGLAVEKRQTAQLLMENADLATFKAAMALRIAEAARVAESADLAASFFLQSS